MQIIKPGTLYVQVSTGVFDVITFTNLKTGKATRGVAIKSQASEKYLDPNNPSYCDPDGSPIIILSQIFYDELCKLLISIATENTDLKDTVERQRQEIGLLKGTLDTLRRNGVID